MLRGVGITEVRGRGAMLGLQIRDAGLSQKVVEYCFEKGIILGWTLHSNSLVRIAPPLIIDEQLLEECFQTILDGVEKYC